MKEGIFCQTIYFLINLYLSFSYCLFLFFVFLMIGGLNMTKQAITKLYIQSKKKAERYYDYYQQGGGTQYYCHYRTFDNIAWLCEQQMDNVSYASDISYFKNFIAGIFGDACKCRYTCNIDDYKDLAQKIINFGQSELKLKNLWS